MSHRLCQPVPRPHLALNNVTGAFKKEELRGEHWRMLCSGRGEPGLWPSEEPVSAVVMAMLGAAVAPFISGSIPSTWPHVADGPRCWGTGTPAPPCTLSLLLSFCPSRPGGRDPSACPWHRGAYAAAAGGTDCPVRLLREAMLGCSEVQVPVGLKCMRTVTKEGERPTPGLFRRLLAFLEFLKPSGGAEQLPGREGRGRRQENRLQASPALADQLLL